MKRRQAGAAVGLAIALMLVATSGAEATFEGRRGRIAYVTGGPRDAAGGDFSGVFDLYTRRRDGSGVRRLTRTQKFSDRDPSWSPDGRSLAWSCRGVWTGAEPPYSADICTIDADGSNRIRFQFDTSVLSPEHSPDGSQIAYVADGLMEPGAIGTPPVPVDEVWVMGRDGTDKTRVTTNTVSETAITWSPDGGAIAYVSWDDSGDTTGLYVVDVATGAERLIAEDVEARPLYRGTRTAYVDWSPDGRHILFVRSSDDDGSVDLFVVDPEGEHEQQVTEELGEYDVSPAWSPDGRAILYRHASEGAHPETGSGHFCIVSFPRRSPQRTDHRRDCPLRGVVEHDYAWQPLA